MKPSARHRSQGQCPGHSTRGAPSHEAAVRACAHGIGVEKCTSCDQLCPRGRLVGAHPSRLQGVYGSSCNGNQSSDGGCWRARIRAWLGDRCHARGRGPPLRLDAEVAKCCGGGKRLRGRDHVDGLLSMEGTDGFTPGVPLCSEVCEICFLTRGLVRCPPFFNLLVPPLPGCGSAGTDVGSPDGSVSLGVHETLLFCVLLFSGVCGLIC
jgi:hypothetical protein